MSVSRSFLFVWTIILFVTVIHAGLTCISSKPSLFTSDVLTVDPKIIHVCPEKECDNEFCDKEYICGEHPVAASPVMTSVDQELGKLTVTYNLRKQPQYSNFDINLYSCENITDPGECSELSLLNRTAFLPKCDLHSTKFFSLKWGANHDIKSPQESCIKDITATFDFVYSSCYFVQIDRCGASTNVKSHLLDPPIVYSCPEIVKTQYTKEIIVDNVVNYAPECRYDTSPTIDNRLVLFLSMSEYFKDIPQSVFSIERYAVDSEEESKYPELVRCHNDAHSVEKNTTVFNHKCTFNDRTLGSCTFKVVEKSKNKTSKVSRTCQLNNLTVGDYMYTLKYNDLRCRDYTVWTKKEYRPGKKTLMNYCTWKSKLACKYLEPRGQQGPVVVSTHFNVFQIMLYVICSLILIAILSFFIGKIYIKRKNSCTSNSYYRSVGTTSSSSTSSVVTLNETRLKSAKKNLLLIYARDCDEFQDVMNEFRSILQNDGFQVFDFWDENQAKDVTYYQFEQWVDRSMENSDMTIVVTNDCAIELEKRNLKGLCVGEQYRCPKNKDNLFKYALSKLKFEISSESEGQLQRIFVVSLKDKVDEQTPFRFESLNLPVSSYHCLPPHLKILLTDLKRLDRMTEIEGLCYESPEYIKFMKAIELYFDFKQRNPHYMRDILIDEISVNKVV